MTRDPPMWTVSGTRRSEAYCVNFSIAVIASASGKCGRPLPTASKSIRWELGDWSSLVSAKIAALHKISNSHSHSFTGESSIFFPGPQIPIVVLPTYVERLSESFPVRSQKGPKITRLSTFSCRRIPNRHFGPLTQNNHGPAPPAEAAKDD